MLRKALILFLLTLVVLEGALAADAYKPYLHTATVPDHPTVRLFGQYNTLLFPGAATYNYPIEVPPGTHGLQPSLTIAYNSQSAQGRPGILGAGWSINQNYLYRDANSTPDDTTDDKYMLVFQNSVYELIYNPNDNLYHTEVDYHFRIQNGTTANNTAGLYWLVTTTDGTSYRFGYDTDSERASNTGRAYAVKWSLDRVTDTYGNTINYAYAQDPKPEDNGTIYLTGITYNTDQQRSITFTYENNTRPDRRLTYEQGNTISESRRLTDITVYASGTLVRRYHLNYTLLSPTMSSLAQITRYGSDNTSILHTITFTYSAPVPGYTKSTQWLPPVPFDNTTTGDMGVRLVDVNNDGFIDILKGRAITSEKLAWINNGSGGWTASTTWIPPVYFIDGNANDTGVRFADVNNDGLVDILTSQNGVAHVYLNNGTGWTDASTTWAIPVDFVNAAGADQGIQLADIDGDGRVDILRAKTGLNNAVYINNGSGWINKASTWNIPVYFTDATDTGARLVDINGDGLPDIIQARDNGTLTRKAWLNTGAGWTLATSTWSIPVDFTNPTFADTGVRLVDVDGDGLVDLVQNIINLTTSINNTWLNNGSGWYLNNTWIVPDGFVKNGSNTGRRLADVDGNGFSDILISISGTAQNAWIKNSATPYLLGNITNEYGGSIQINYTTSTRYNNTDQNGDGMIGFNMFVVNTVLKNNNLTGTQGVIGLNNYSYTGGKYNYSKREFRGFAITTEQQPSTIIKHYFYQDSPRRGKEYETDVYNLSGTLFSRNVKDYNYTYLYGVYNISLLFSTTYQYDGSSTPRVTNTTYVYDWFGNPLSVQEQGDLSVSGDERTTNYTYAYNKNPWILNHLATTTVYDASGNKVKQTFMYYDGLGLAGMGTTGSLTKREDWNNNSNNSVTTYDYDNYGNAIRATDATGATTLSNYDTTHTYVASTINPLGHISYIAYDLGTGNLLWSKKNEITTAYTYDVHGRPATEIQPYDSIDLPTKRYTYNLTGTAPSSVHVAVRTTANKTQDMTYYYDGFGNLIQLQTATDTRGIVKNLYYDAAGRVSAEDNPYLVNTTSSYSTPATGTPQTNYTYDALDRVVLVRNPDGTNKTTRFNRANITDADENGHAHVYAIDALGRITTVIEQNNDPRLNLSEQYTTNYSYDANDNLITITDHLGHNFRFSYDTLSRKIAMSDPDMGNWSYAYDTRGNLILQTDARGQNITLTYDALGRLTSKNSTDVNETFTYDSQYQGTLTNLTMNSVTCQYTYDDRLRTVSKTDTIEGTPFTTSYIYDSQNRLISEQGLGNDVDYLYDRQGTVRSIPGYITDAKYDAFGSLLNRTYANGLISTMAYNTTNHRLASISIPGIQNLTYAYDNAGNINSINDVTAGKLTTLRYDNLDRLIEATIGSDRYEYTYNPTGNIMNIVKNNASKKFVYNNLAHAPSSIIDAGTGADVYHVTSLATGSKNRTIEYFLVNDQNTTTTGVNTSIDFGNGQTVSVNNLSVNTSILFLVQQNYTRGGDYTLNITSNAPNSSDYETKPIKFGVRATGLGINASNISERTFEFDIASDVIETLPSVTWNCTGNSTGQTVNLTGSLANYFKRNFTTSGPETFTCTATGIDGNETRTITFTVNGLEINTFDTLSTNVSRRVIAFNAKNNYYPLRPNISVTYEGGTFSTLANLSTNEQVMVFAEVNNTLGNAKGISVNLTAGNDTQLYTSIYDVKGVSIDSYQRVDTSNLSKIYLYAVRNLWYNATMSWSFSDPAITNATSLANNQTLFVFIASNYTQGDKTPTLNASVLTATTSIRDHFFSKPLALTSLLTLSEGASAVSELSIKNYLDSQQNVTWQFDTGQQNYTNTTTMSGSLLVYVQSNYTTTGVYRTRANISNTNYADNRTGVIIQ